MKNKLRLGVGIEKSCALCAHSADTAEEGKCLCVKKSFVYASDVCRKYEYDPFKRVPIPAPKMQEHKKEEFEI